MNTRAVAIAFATLFVALRATAQGNDKALETIARAETMATAGDTAGALTLLEKGKSGCPSPDYHDCNVLYNFALGYLWTVQAGRTHAMEDRNQAFDAFARVLSVDPDNADTWINIAHLQQLAGHAEEAADAFSRAEAAEGDAMGRYFFAAAETLRQAGNLSRSEELFRRAGEAGAVDAWPELVALKAERIRRMEAGPRTIELLRALDLAHELRDRQASGAASEALELVIAESFADWPVIAESALEEWAENHAKNATLTGAALKRLPSLEQWKSAMLLQLAESVQQRTWRFRDEWIRAGESRRHAAIEASVAIANDAVGRGDLESAETLFEAARIYEDSPVIELQLARIALARHDEAGFNAVIDRLYGAKESAYQTKDRPAEQELHVVLGAIYKERGIWKSRDEDVGRNATFHFQEAISVTREREQQEEILQPIPHLYEWVVTGYLASDRKDDARDAAVGAARDYLEVDALAEAERMLQVAKGIESQDAPAVVAMRTLESIIAGRREGNVNGAANWTATQLLDAAFIARQKFKLFADTAQAAGDDAVAQRYSAAALDAVAQQNFLTGVADEIRLSHVRRAIEQMVSWAPADVRRSSNARSWKVATPDNSDRTVTWPAALVIRGRSTSEGP